MRHILALCVLAGQCAVLANQFGHTVELSRDDDDRLLLKGDVGEGQEEETIPTYGYKIVKEYPHNTASWTEGLSFVGDKLYESTGPGAVAGTKGGGLMEVNLETGKPTKTTSYKGIYGEGAAHVGDKFYVLSYKEGKIEEFNDGLSKKGESALPAGGNGMGWGATTDGKNVVYSDGSDKIRYMNPKTKKVEKTITVIAGSQHISNLNELEWVNNEIWANVWQTYKIARIDPETGHVKSWVDLTGIHAPSRDIGANGIAYDPASKKLLVTGKNWDHLYQIEAVPKASNNAAPVER